MYDNNKKMKNQSQEEIWKDIKGYEGLYQVSNLGRVKSLARAYSNRCRIDKIMNPWIAQITGYVMTKLSKNDGTKGKYFKVHLLVWETFSDTLRDGRKIQVDHIDEDKTNNAYDNLQLLTARANKSKERLINKLSGLPTGVYYHDQSKKYRARIYYKGKQISLGLHFTPEVASQAYQRALQKLGEAA